VDATVYVPNVGPHHPRIGLYHVKDIVGTPLSPVPFIVAILTSAVVGVLSIRFLLDYLKKKGFALFTVYRFLLGAFVIILYLARG
jgi:undecaprenyl-diphosphatase